MSEIFEKKASGRHVAPNSMTARVMLAFLATAGIFYINIIPAIVDGLVEGLAFSSRQAGFASSANIYGAAAGALLIVFVIKRVRWRPVSYCLLAALILMDLLSMLITVPEAMIAFRFFHGCIGGALVGVGFSVIARTLNPDRTFGVLLIVQFGLGGLGNLYIPRLVPIFGTNVLFLSLIAFSLVTLLMVPFLDNYSIKSHDGNGEVKIPSSSSGKIAIVPLLLVMVAIFLFQFGNNGLFAYIIGLGKSSGLDLAFITSTLAASGWIAILGAVFVVAIYTKYGRTIPIAAALITTIVATWALHFSGNGQIFLIANIVIGITWAFTMSYFLGLTAEFDKAGQMAALAGFASKMGLASGPMVDGILLVDDKYSILINVAVVALVASMAASIIPAKYQDQRAKLARLPEAEAA